MDKLIFNPSVFIWQIVQLLLLIGIIIVVYKVVRKYLRNNN